MYGLFGREKFGHELFIHGLCIMGFFLKHILTTRGDEPFPPFIRNTPLLLIPLNSFAVTLVHLSTDALRFQVSALAL